MLGRKKLRLSAEDMEMVTETLDSEGPARFMTDPTLKVVIAEPIVAERLPELFQAWCEGSSADAGKRVNEEIRTVMGEIRQLGLDAFMSERKTKLRETGTCKRCHGSGSIVSEDWVDYGSTRALLTQSWECDQCIENGKCPKCGAKTLNSHRNLCMNPDCNWENR